MTDPIRVFVGAGPEQRVPFLVLKHSIERRASRPVVVRNLLDFPEAVAPTPKDPANRPRTPFSFQRFAIPKICNYEGRAIYLDSDMIVLDDIAKLWDEELFGRPVLATCVDPAAWNAVLLIDCEEVTWDLDRIVDRLDRGANDYRGLMEGMAWLGPISRTLNARWNRLDEYVEGDTSLVHFTDMRRQPWRRRGHPLEGLWIKEREAMEELGYLAS